MAVGAVSVTMVMVIIGVICGLYFTVAREEVPASEPKTTTLGEAVGPSSKVKSVVLILKENHRAKVS